MKRIRILLILFALLLIVLSLRLYMPDILSPIINKLSGKSTVGDRLQKYGPAVRKRLASCFTRCNVTYPPSRMVIVGLKEEKVMHVYAAEKHGALRFVRSYPIMGASGHIGPKLQYGDCQVPEGIYHITFLNPNSLYHLSLRLDYPNKFDCAMGKRDGRDNLGSDIMIHGGAASVGCLAMGDEAAEDLFVLAADTGIENIKVILSPVDFRSKNLPTDYASLPKWIDEVYGPIKSELKRLPPADD